MPLLSSGCRESVNCHSRWCLVLGDRRFGLAGDWTDRRTVGPLLFRADFSLGPLEELLRDVAALQDDLTRATGMPAGKELIEVYLFERQETYAAYLKQYLPQGGLSAGALRQGRRAGHGLRLSE